MTWKDVQGYEGVYKVSDTGEVLSLARKGNWRGNHLMIPQEDRCGYKMITMTKNGKARTERIHRLVAMAFVPNPHNYREVNHKDENKSNCSAKTSNGVQGLTISRTEQGRRRQR